MKRHESLLQRIGEHRLTTRYGEVRINGFVFGDNQQVVIAISAIEIAQNAAHLLRIQYGCEYGTVLGSLDCDCGLQITASMKLITAKGGTLLYFRDHEAHGFGLAGKIRMTELEKSNNWSLQQTERALGLIGCRPDVLWTVPEVLRHIGVAGPIALLGLNEHKRDRLIEIGVDVSSVLPLDIDTTDLSQFALFNIDSPPKGGKRETL